MGNFHNDLDAATTCRLLGQHELNRIRPYLHRGELISNFATVSVAFDNAWTYSMPLLMCVEKPYGHLCIFHSKYALCDSYDSHQIDFDIGVHRYTSKEFHTICSQIDETHPGFCYISYALVAICHKQSIIDLHLET